MTEKKLGRNDPCWCGSQKKYKHCHMEMDEQIDRFRREGHTVPTRQMIKTPEQIEGIRQSSRINIAVLDLVAQKIHEGMTTEEIDKIVYEETTRLGGIPAPLNYESTYGKRLHLRRGGSTSIRWGGAAQRRHHQCRCIHHLAAILDSSHAVPASVGYPKQNLFILISQEMSKLGLKRSKPTAGLQALHDV